ncbi:glycosyltransferase family A protein [Pseudoxanthomonas sp. LjRoot143]|uniref:glycosyltransferase family 2 protein n=1 Tax=Pseudoxanthomonas sp. LjRoot143 TaxID=3342266 RepID=UPI003ECF8BBC
MSFILSTIIPTFRRPHYLGRAIESALSAAPTSDVEVVVVPNGPDDSWKAVATTYKNDARISWHCLKVGHACAARNHGLAKASGKYIRFLDDDDYLYPAAADQLTLIDLKNADLCSAPLENVREDGTPAGRFQLPDSDDYPTAALLSIAISGFTQGSIFKRSLIKDFFWKDDIALYDDYLWMLGLAEREEIDWLKTQKVVGAYTQHYGSRLSRISRSEHNSQPLVTAILKLHDSLAESDRLSPQRASAVASALLTHAHSAFPSCPVLLSDAIRRAKEIDSSARPAQALFLDHPWLADHMLAAQWAMVAPRYLTRGYRKLSWIVKGKFGPVVR